MSTLHVPQVLMAAISEASDKYGAFMTPGERVAVGRLIAGKPKRPEEVEAAYVRVVERRAPRGFAREVLRLWRKYDV
jgi:hypothetical protein